MDKPVLHIVFTLDCEDVADKSHPQGPRSWELSGRAIEGFSTRVLNAGYKVTLFVGAECAAAHGPLFEEQHERGAELGLLVDPPRIENTRYSKRLGQYTATQQREIIMLEAARYEAVIDVQPRSFRSGLFSASDETFKLLYELGFRQGSLSNPGQDLPRMAASWINAPVDAHYVDSTNRLNVGTLPFLELPPTTDPNFDAKRGLPAQLRIEIGSVEEWLGPLVEAQLKRMETEQVAFRALCIGSATSFDYGRKAAAGKTLDAFLDYLDTLRNHYEIVPVTLATAHERFRWIAATSKV